MYEYRLHVLRIGYLLYTLNSEQIRLNNVNKYILLGCKDISNTSVFFYNKKNWFLFIWYSKRPRIKKIKDDL